MDLVANASGSTGTASKPSPAANTARSAPGAIGTTSAATSSSTTSSSTSSATASNASVFLSLGASAQAATTSTTTAIGGGTGSGAGPGDLWTINTSGSTDLDILTPTRMLLVRDPSGDAAGWQLAIAEALMLATTGT